MNKSRDTLTSTYESAVYYIEKFNWFLVPIPPGTKNPTNPGWNLANNAMQTPEDAKFWEKNPDWNMGLLLSESRMIALDIDNVPNTQMAFSAMGLDYEEILKGAPRIVGRPGRDKALFKAPLDIPLSRKTLAWNNKETDKPEVVFEMRAGAIQDVLPPSIHPDTHLPYKWKVYPSNGIPDLPKELLTIWKEWEKFKPQLVTACPWSKETVPIPPKKIRTITKRSEDVIGAYNSSHNIESLLEEYGYKRKLGTRYLSPYSTSGLAGVVVYPNENRIYSHHASDPFDTSHSLDAFDLFCHFAHKGNVTDAVKAAANIVNMGPTIFHEDNDILLEHGKELTDGLLGRKKRIKAPEILLQIPGVLQDAVDYYNSTSIKHQPQFAVQCALAIGATVMGRRYTTDHLNYPSLYLVTVGDTSTGKEHMKTVVEAILMAAQVDSLIGPSGYTSSGGVYTALASKPSHIAIIDELGRLMESAKASKNSNSTDAQTTIMEVFGRLGGVLRPQGYSAMTTTETKSKDMMSNKYVNHPAITILGMTVPSNLYNSLSSDYIKSGFIPRFIIVETDLGRVKSKKPIASEISNRLIEWIRERSNARESEGNATDDKGMLQAPNPVIVPFEESCYEMLDAYEDNLNDIMDKSGSMDAMYGKTREIAMRISLIIAVSSGSDKIMPKHLEWAIEYVNYYTDQAVAKLKATMSDSPFEAVCKQVYDIIEKSGTMGSTDREIARSSALIRSYTPDERTKVMKALQDDYGISLCPIEHKGGGRSRNAWVTEDVVNQSKSKTDMNKKQVV